MPKTLLTLQHVAYELARQLYNETWDKDRCLLFAGVVVETDLMPLPGAWYVVSFPPTLVKPEDSFGLPPLRIRVSNAELLDFADLHRHYTVDPHSLGYGLDA